MATETRTRDEDWLRTRSWDVRFPNGKLVETLDDYLLVEGVLHAPDDEKRAKVEHLLSLPAAEAMPEGMRAETSLVISARKQTFGDPKVGHREPNKIELAAGTDFILMQSSWKVRTSRLVRQWKEQVKILQVNALVAAFEVAIDSGVERQLAIMQAPALGDEILLDAMSRMAEEGLTSARTEAGSQGVNIEMFELGDDLTALLRARSEASAELMARGLGDSAARFSSRLGVNVADKASALNALEEHLLGLSDSYLNDMLGGALTQAQNEGRRAVMSQAPSTIYASELLDLATCAPCAAVDEQEYDTPLASTTDYPTGGYKDCLGGPRCRGTLVAVYDEAAPS